MLSNDPRDAPETRPAAEPSPAIDAVPPRTHPTLPVDGWSGYVSADPRPRGITSVQVLILVVGLLAGAALFLSGFSLGRQAATTPGTPITEEQAFAPFWDAYRAITEQYAGGEVERKTLIEGAIRGMIEALGDPYSSYLSSEEYRQSLQGISGQFEGIGAELGGRNADGSDGGCSPLSSTCLLVVIQPIEGSPAQGAGLLKDDIVLTIDGTPVDGLTIDEAVGKVRGPKGTTVVLGVRRGTAAPIDISVVRDVIVEREVILRSLAGGTVSYIRLTGFSENGAAEVVAALRQDIAEGQRKFILDLRGNPGGFVTAARTVASQFIAEGPIFWQEDAKGTQISTNAQPGGVAVDRSVRVVVLIDRGSASAAEIVAGALQDTGRALLVGDNSFGKGTVQEWQPLPDDTGGFRLTVAKWLTPNKRWVHQTGLTPDARVDPGAPEVNGQDATIAKALEVLGATAALPLMRRAA